MALWLRPFMGLLAQGLTPGSQKSRGWVGREQSKRESIPTATVLVLRVELDTAQGWEDRQT